MRPFPGALRSEEKGVMLLLVRELGGGDRVGVRIVLGFFLVSRIEHFSEEVLDTVGRRLLRPVVIVNIEVVLRLVRERAGDLRRRERNVVQHASEDLRQSAREVIALHLAALLELLLHEGALVLEVLGQRGSVGLAEHAEVPLRAELADAGRAREGPVEFVLVDVLAEIDHHVRLARAVGALDCDVVHRVAQLGRCAGCSRVGSSEREGRTRSRWAAREVGSRERRERRGIHLGDFFSPKPNLQVCQLGKN
jgi:hypothetical protein